MSSEPDHRARIRDTLAAYCHAIDDGRFDDFARCFATDAVVTVMGQRVEGRDAIRSWMEQAMPPELRGRHVNVNIDIDLEADGRARAVSDFLFLSRDGDGWDVTQLGRYFDELVHDGEAWRLSQRRIVLGTEPGD